MVQLANANHLTKASEMILKLTLIGQLLMNNLLTQMLLSVFISAIVQSNLSFQFYLEKLNVQNTSGP